MSNNDPRLGKKGQFRPQTTLQGNALKSPPASELSLGDGWFVELDANRVPHWRELVEEVRNAVPKSASKSRAKRTVEADEQE